jgi:dihydropteroate synthase
MGVGNLTELTHADTAGMNALLLGVCSELGIRAILTTQVSHHACRAVAEADRSRRMLFAAHELNSLPKLLDDGLMSLHERKPFPYSPEEVEILSQQIRDPSYRIQISTQGLHIFNRDGLHSATNPFSLYPSLGVASDGGHAFYLGVELARAQIAWQLGKRYTQDEELKWGCALPPAAEDRQQPDPHVYKPAGATLQKPQRETE